MRESSKASIGFGTLALGDQYQVLAKLLGLDLARYHPDIKFFVLTDKPNAFDGCNNIVAIYHSFGGVRGCYHDKRKVVGHVLQHCESCIFLDADCRILGPINFSPLYDANSLIVSIFSESLISKLNTEIKNKPSSFGINNPARRLRLYCALAKIFCVDLHGARFVQESCFFINGKCESANRFLNNWEKSFRWLTLRLMEFGEGSAIGLSALAAGGEVKSLEYTPDWFFKDLYTNHSWRSANQINRYNELVDLRLLINSQHRKKDSHLYKYLKYLYRYFRVLLTVN